MGVFEASSGSAMRLTTFLRIETYSALKSRPKSNDRGFRMYLLQSLIINLYAKGKLRQVLIHFSKNIFAATFSKPRRVSPDFDELSRAVTVIA